MPKSLGKKAIMVTYTGAISMTAVHETTVYRTSKGDYANMNFTDGSRKRVYLTPVETPYRHFNWLIEYTLE